MSRKVLYVSPSAERAGAERLTQSFITGHSSEWKPEVFFLREGPFVRDLRALGIPCYVSRHEGPARFPNPWSMLQVAAEISKLARTRDIGLIHSLMGYGHVLGGLAAKHAGIPEVWFQHGTTGPLGYLTGMIPSSAVLVNSRHTEKRQLRYNARGEVRLIYPALPDVASVARAEAEGARLRENWFPGGASFVFGIVGRIAKMKGQHLFIEAALELLHDDPSLGFAIIGNSFEGREKGYLEELRKGTYSDRIVFTGFQEDAAAAYCACDSVVNASTVAEPFGLSVLEALQLGRPVIAPNQGGPVEIFEDGAEGFFFEAGDPFSLGLAMRAALLAHSEPHAWQALQRGARRIPGDRFPMARMLQQLEQVYEGVCGSPLPSPMPA